MVILDEAHKARKSRALGQEAKAGNLYKFMMKIADKTRHLIPGTATPIQTEPDELWDLLEILNPGATHVLGRQLSQWRVPSLLRPLLVGEQEVLYEDRAWNLLRNPLPPRDERNGPFEWIYQDLGTAERAVDFTDRAIVDLQDFTRDDIRDGLRSGVNGMPFFRYHNPVSRHVVLRRRETCRNDQRPSRVAYPLNGPSLPM